MKKRFLSMIIALVFAFFSFNIFACTLEDGGDDGGGGSQPIEVTSVNLSSTMIDALEGETYTLTATVLPENATSKSVVWKSSNESVVTVLNGVVTTIGVGTAKITATTSNGVSGSCTVVVRTEYIEVTSVSISENTLELTEGDTHTLTATVLPENATDKSVTWTSSNDSVAIVANGVVTAVGEGDAVITAVTKDGVEDTCAVAVNKKIIPVTSVKLNARTIDITEGQTYTLIATVLPEDATDKSVTWTSSDKSVATVENGVVTVHKDGSAVITAVSKNGKIGSCVVNGKEEVFEVESVTLSETQVEITEEQTYTLTATILPEKATNKTLIWSSSDDGIVAVCDGVITAIKSGDAVITVVSSNGIASSCLVIVKEKIIEVESITLSETKITALEGEYFILTATVLPENATDKSLTWYSSNEDVATVEDGEVRFHNWGDAEITAESNNNIVAKCKVTVKVDKEPLTFSRLYINTENKQSINSKEVYVNCTVSVANTELKYCFNDYTARIKGRGNSTWGMPKKPYKLKFDSKVDLFGNGKAKTWTLIANYCDPSLVRNHLAYALADNFESLESTTKIHTVDLYLNGVYNGVYLVCEQNETGSTRVDVDENLAYVDTGYLIELDARASSEGVEGVDYFVSNGNYVIKGPETDDPAFTTEHLNFIKNYTTNAYASLKKSWSEVCEYLDVQSFVDAYIIHEIFSMVDVGFASFYLHKDAGGKLNAGPLWDLDISSGNCNYHDDAVRTDYMWAANNSWYRRLLAFDEFKKMVSDRLMSFNYERFITDEINEILKYEDAYNANFSVWQTMGVYVWPNSDEIVAIKTWKGQVEYLREWLLAKLNFMIGEYVVTAGSVLSHTTDVFVTDGIFAIDLSEFDNIGEIVSVKVAGKQFSNMQFDGRYLVLDTMTFGTNLGEQNVIIMTTNMVITAPVVAITKVLYTAQDLTEWWNIVGIGFDCHTAIVVENLRHDVHS